MKSEKDQKTGLLVKEVSLSGKLAKEVAAFLDIVVFMYMREMEIDNETKQTRLLLSQATDTCTAKDRTAKLPQVMIEPTMASIEQRPPLPPFTYESAVQKVRIAEDSWNTRDPAKVALAYSPDSRWRNRAAIACPWSKLVPPRNVK